MSEKSGEAAIPRETRAVKAPGSAEQPKRRRFLPELDGPLGRPGPPRHGWGGWHVRDRAVRAARDDGRGRHAPDSGPPQPGGRAWTRGTGWRAAGPGAGQRRHGWTAAEGGTTVPWRFYRR